MERELRNDCENLKRLTDAGGCGVCKLARLFDGCDAPLAVATTPPTGAGCLTDHCRKYTFFSFFFIASLTIFWVFHDPKINMQFQTIKFGVTIFM